MGGIADFDEDNEKEIVYLDDSEVVRYYNKGGGINSTGVSVGSNNGVGVGEPADLNGDGNVRTPIVNGSQEVRLLDENGATTLVASNATKSPVTAEQWDGDDNLEVLGKYSDDGYPHVFDLEAGENGAIYNGKINGSVGTCSPSEHYGRQVAKNENITLGPTSGPGSIRFIGRNIYYPDQTYVYQGGHVILIQDGSEVMLESTPSMISWKKVAESEYRIEAEYPFISGENSSIASTGSKSVSLERKGENQIEGQTENLTIRVSTDYENAWLSYLEDEADGMPPGLSRAGIKNGKPYLNVASGDNVVEYSVTAENIEAVI